MNIEPGCFVVIVSRYSFSVAKVERVTAQKVFYLAIGMWGKPAPHQCFKSAVKFAGAEDVANRLCQQLQSSDARCSEEKRQANLRRNERDAKFIAEAERAS